MSPSKRRSVLRRAALSLLIVALAGAAYVVRWRPLPSVGEWAGDRFSRVAGVVHVHTTHSDGGGSPDDVVRAAHEAGLGFVIITDHNNLDAKPIEGYREGVLVGVGTELSTTGGHLLTLGLDEPSFRFGGEPDQALDDANLLGAASFAAHPISPRADFNWSGWDLPGAWGLELLNGDSQWREAGALRLALTLGLYGLNSRYALLRSLSSTSQTLERWDQLLERRDVPAITGADAHARVPLGRKRGLPFPAYEAVFGLVRNHVLLEAPLSGDADQDLERVIGALRRGRNYVGLDALAPADAVSFVAERGAQRWTMGDTVEPGSGLRLRAAGRWPAGAELTLLRNGQVCSRGAALDFEVRAAGVYRLEIRLAGWDVPWVLTNPIYVFPPEVQARRRATASWPVVPVAAARAQFFDFARPTGLVPEHDEASLASASPDGTGGLRFEFDLSDPSRPGTRGPVHGWAALMSRQPRDLSGYQGLLLRLRADGVYRLWVQLRDRNPRGSDEGHETWLRSVRGSLDVQTVALPFERFRSLDPRSDGRLDLAQVTSVGLVLDDLTIKPGTRGTLWLEALDLY